MSKFEDHIKAQHREAYLIDDGNRSTKTKEDYIKNAEVGLIVAFRLNFDANSGVKLTKVISGKILENNSDDEEYIVETVNGLKYGVPHDTVIWVKTGNRWPKGVYEEMKQGSVPVDEHDFEFSSVESDSKEESDKSDSDFLDEIE